MSSFDEGERTLLVRRRLLQSALGGVAALSLATQVTLASEKAGQVDDLSGEAIAELEASRRRLIPGEVIYVGDTVMTGEASRIGLTVGSATTLRLGARAKLTIDRFLIDAGGVLSLKSGPLLFDRPPGSTTQQVQIRGAFGLIAIRGTQIFAGPSRGKMAVFVRRGSVSVTSGDKIVLLNAGEGSDVPEIGAPPTAPIAWSQERINEALASVS